MEVPAADQGAGDLWLAVLSAMPDAHDLKLIGGDAVDDDVRPDERDLSRSRDQSGPAPLGKVFQTIARSDDLDGDAGRRCGVALANVGSDFAQVRLRIRRKDYGHSGGGISLSVPQESSQRRTFS